MRYQRNAIMHVLVIVLISLLILSWWSFKWRNFARGSTFVAHSFEVHKPIDLLDIDISEILKSQAWDKLGIDSQIESYNFTTKTQDGFVSNINIDAIKNLETGFTNDEDGLLLFDPEWKLFSHRYDKIVSCSHLRYSNNLEYYKFPTELNVDFKSARRDILDADDGNASAYSASDENMMQEDEILSKRWYSFGAAPVWLKDENCYVSYTRLIYSKFGDRTWSYISIVYGQTFDKDWNEITNKRIFFRDVKMPQEIKNKIRKLESELHSDKCEKSSDYRNCKDNSILQKKIDKLYDKYSIKYPTTFKIPFQVGQIWNGAEDPHVILKKDKEGEEPVVVFNLQVQNGKKMNAYLPHRKHNYLVEFTLEHGELRRSEKNWAPFFYPDMEDSNNNFPGFIHFVYDFNPIEILRCSLLTGLCNFIFQASTLNIEKGGTFIFRGGTQFVSLPDILPKVKNVNMWIGFMKEHVEHCGCGDRLYRPTLSLLIEKNGLFYLQLITPNIDFNEDVLGWSLKDNRCGGYNVLSPSSIANWYVLSQDPNTRKFEDYIALAVSEADSLSRMTYVKGVLNYVLGIYEQMDLKETFDIDRDTKHVIEKTAQCGYELAAQYCKKYGIEHRS